MQDSQSYTDTDRKPVSMEQAIQNLRQQKNSNKRKREATDQNGNGKHLGPRSISTSNQAFANGSNNPQENFFPDDTSSNEFASLGQQLARHVANANAMPSTAAAALAAQLTVPQPTELSFPTTTAGNEEDRLDSSFDMGGADTSQHHHTEGTPYNLDSFDGATAAQMQAARDAPGSGGTKPTVGSDAWHKVRRDNHKEVERRRRETINEGINELANIVPGCDKNKGAILQRGVQYITQLKDNETRNIEKWTLEKLLTDQAIAELSTSVDNLKSELERAWKEAERWKKKCQENGLEPRAENDAGGEDEDGKS